MIHDAFQPVSYWNNFMPPSKYDGVFLDTHIYQVFSDAVSKFQVLLDIINFIWVGRRIELWSTYPDYLWNEIQFDLRSAEGSRWGVVTCGHWLR